MKTRYIIALVTGLLIGFVNVAAQTEKVYNDVKGELPHFNVENGYSVVLNVTGDIIINTTSQFRVREGGELRIVNSTSSNIKIINQATSPSEGRLGMFVVHSGAKMTIDGGTAGITIDGGAELKRTNQELAMFTGSENRKFKFSMIMTCGTLTMNNVTLQNYYGGGDCGALGIVPLYLYDNGANKKCGPTILNDCTIENCKSVMGTAVNVGNDKYLDTNLTAEECRIELNNCIIQNCEVTIQKDGTYDGNGGVFRLKGGSYNKVYLTNTVFKNNYSHYNGASLWWNAAGKPETKCVINGCQFINNIAAVNGAGPNIEASFEFTGNMTTISGNRCGGNGAGILLQSYKGAAGIVGGTLTFNLPSCLEVMNNTAGNNGGGVAFIFDSNNLNVSTHINTYFDGALIHDNTAGGSGGGVYFINSTDPARKYTFNIELNSGAIENNTAADGGGIYVQDMIVSSDPSGSSSVFITNNNATQGNGGGIYLNSGTLNLRHTYVLGNTAVNGGGLFVHHGQFTSSEGSVISDNSCEEYGGGVYIKNENKNSEGSTEDKRDVIELTGGSISNNTAKYGGGLAAYGNLRVEITNTSIEANTAEIGGGVFTTGLVDGKKSGTILNYNSGLIRHNRAKSTTPISTAYSTDYKLINGVGGGFYIGEYTLLDFPSIGQVGIYNNIADNAADDIFGHNNMVIVNLPNVSNLELSGFSGENVTNLYWVEDYVTNDSNYSKGLNLRTDSAPNQRYRDIIEDKVTGHYYHVNFGSNDVIQYTNKYLCLALGWHINKITLIKEGMKDGENAIFTIYKDGVAYMNVMLTDQDKKGDGTRSKIIEFKSDGEYRIVESNWSWAYNAVPNEIIRTINIGSSVEERIFTFSNTADSNAPIHSEDTKINKIEIT